MRPDEDSATARTLALLAAIAARPGATLAEAARPLGLPRSTAHRLVAPLVARGFVTVVGRGRYLPGPAALDLGRQLTRRALVVAVARPLVAALARRCGTHAHLGLYEGGMVTYAVRQAHGRDWLFSQEGAQLEAYCSAIGKALLAQLAPDALDRYLSQDAFVALTPATITRPAALRTEIAAVRARGWAGEDGEIMAGLSCLAVPVPGCGLAGPAALSLSFASAPAAAARRPQRLAALRDTAALLGRRAGVR